MRELGGFRGNQLFEVAATVGIAHAIGARPALPARWSYRPYFNCPDEWFRPARGRSMEAWRWEGLDYMDERARLYLQDPALFRDVADLIRDAFQPSERAAAEHLGWNPRWDNAIAVHVRRGDLLTQTPGFQPALTVDAPDYYRTALDVIDPMGAMPVVVFSDDPAWCDANQSETFGRPVEIEWHGEPRSHIPRQYRSQKPMDWVDLILMSQFDRLVMSNSTFAVWAAYLGGAGQQVLHPSIWFGPMLDHVDWRLMIPSQGDPLWHGGWREVPCG